MEQKKIILENGKPPQFNGSWTVGEVLQMAQALAHWAESLSVPSNPPQQEQPKRDK